MNMHDVAEFRQHPRMSGFGWMTLVVLGLIAFMAWLGQRGA